MSQRQNWIWMPHAAHLIVGDYCQFHLATYVGGGYLVSTVGEYWPDSAVRHIHDKVNVDLHGGELVQGRGDEYDYNYRQKYGFEDIGYGRKYETMVFKGVKGLPDQCLACPYVIESGRDLDFEGYSEPAEAYAGHMAMCEKWSKK